MTNNKLHVYKVAFLPVQSQTWLQSSDFIWESVHHRFRIVTQSVRHTHDDTIFPFISLTVRASALISRCWFWIRFGRELLLYGRGWHMWNTAVSTLNIIPDIHRMRSTPRVSITMRRKIILYLLWDSTWNESAWNTTKQPQATWMRVQGTVRRTTRGAPKMPVLQVKRAPKGYWGIQAQGSRKAHLGRGRVHRRRRCAETEAVFGQMKTDMGCKRFRNLGKDKVEMVEFAFFAIAFNIKKMARIIVKHIKMEEILPKTLVIAIFFDFYLRRIEYWEIARNL